MIRAIYSLWYSILNYSDELIKWIQDIVINVETWEICRDIYKNEKDDILELGKSNYFF